MQCPQCQHENREGAKFCNECAAPFSLRCPSCETLNTPGAKFCDECATPLSEQPSSSRASQEVVRSVPQDAQPTRIETLSTTSQTPDAERRQLTVMFCDLIDSTRLTGQLDPEDLREVIRAYQERAAGVIQQYEGHIAQYLGDGLLVYFGWPRAHEDDAQRAVHTGLGIVEAVDDLNMRLKTAYRVQLAVRLGIHTGPVVVGEMGGGGRHENLALGETPNIAARLEGLAQPGTVVISDDTRRLVAGVFNYDTMGTPELKGVSESIPVFRVQGLSSAVSRFEATTSTLTPMVGREVEVDLLMRCWEQVLEGEGQVVLLNGPPGIGKSRLLQALCDRLSDAPHVRLRYQCSPYHTNSALYPIATHMTRAMQLPPDASSGMKLERLETLVTQTGLPIEEAVSLFSAMLSIPTGDRYPTLTLNPQGQKERTLELFAQGLVNLSRQDPVLFLFEDVHWGDPTSLEALSLVIDQVQDVRVLVVLTYRPEFESTWRDYGHVTTYTLNRLSRRQTLGLVEHVTGGKALPAEVLDQIVAKTDGVPLYVEELFKMLLDSELLREEADRYELTGPLTTVAIPDTLQDSLMARLDQMKTAKEVAQLGAVLGREFTYDMLQAVTSQDEETLQEGLAQLVSAELLYQRGRPPRATYLFKHALIQDVAYTSLLRSTRQQVHYQMAQVLEERFPEVIETQPELLAHHYTEAGQDESAISYWQQAGQHAIGRSAHVEAIAHLRQGLAVLTRLPHTPERLQQELDLQVALGPELFATKGNAALEVERTYARARELCQQSGDSLQLFPVLRGLMLYYQARGQMQAVTELGEQLLQLAQAQSESALLLLAHHMLGVALYYRGEPAQAQHHHNQACMIYDPEGHQNLRLDYGLDLGVASLFWLAWELWQLGYPDQAMQRIQATRKLAQEVSHPYTLAMALGTVAIVHQHRHHVLETQELAADTMTVTMEQGFPLYLGRSTVLHGWALAMQGQSETGIAEIHQGLDHAVDTGDKIFRPYFLGLLAEAYGEGRDPKAGLEVLNEALAVMDTTEVRFYAAELYRIQGDLLLKQDISEAIQAEACFQQALSIAQSQQAKSFELRTATSLARLWQSQDKRQEAYDLLAPVYEWFTEGFDTADLIDARSLLDELHIEKIPPMA